jgi:uncharacterized protein DUF3471
VISDALSPYPLAYTHMNMYGLGWAVRDFRGYKVVEHHGDIDGMSACISMIPEKKVAVIILTNLHGPGSTYAIAPCLFEQALGITSDFDWNAYFLTHFKQSTHSVTEQMKHTTPSLALEGYSGCYHNDFYGDLVIEEKQGALVVRLLAFHSPLSYLHFDTFYFDTKEVFPLLQERLFLSFSINQKGVVDSVSVCGEGLINCSFRKKDLS